MKLIDKMIQKGARSQLTLPLKDYIGKKLRETYYNAEVLHRIEAKTEPLNMRSVQSAPARVNLLLPEINFRSFYGGYMAKFHLARKLVAEGYNVRFVIVDPCVQAPKAWREAVSHYAGLKHIFDDVEVSYQGDRRQVLEVSEQDRFIATTWWTAYLADDAVRRIPGPAFVYLIQEYEPFTFPMGSYYSMAHHSYSFPHHALFSSSLLQEYFHIQSVGIYAEHDSERGANYFENAIVGFSRGELDAAMERKKRPGTKKKLLF